MNFARSENMRILQRLVEVDSLLYPETLKVLFLVRPAFNFHKVWTIVQNVFSSRTRSKIKIVSMQETLEALQVHIPEEVIPRDLGGSRRKSSFVEKSIPPRLLQQ